MKYHKGGWLLLVLLLRSTLGWAQSSEVAVNDLAFVLGDAAGQYSNRTQLRDALQAFSERHALGVSLTLLEEDQLYQANARQQETEWLQRASPTLAITSWHDRDTKARSRTQVQVNEAMATRLPQATAEQIIIEALDYYSTNPLSGDALLQGMSLALRRLDAYLDGLPPAGEVPTTTFTNPVTAPPAAPPSGLDQMRYPAHRGNYEPTTIHQTDYAVAWKALPSGSPTTVLAQVDQEVSFPPGVVFRQNNNSVPSQPGSQTHQQQLTLTGQAHQQEGSLLVYASAEEDAELVGKLNTISYDVLPKTLVLIALDGTIDEYDPEVQQTGQEVQRIFAQAGVELNVTFEHFNTTWGHRDTLLEDNTSGMLSNYPKQLKRVIKDYRKAHKDKEEEETAYIFLAGGGTSGRKGYMPKKRNYGFVFVHEHTARESLARTIAHELGHGWFRLEHNWQTYPALTEGSTDNLMDYGKGKTLHKYQWDLIHDPVSMLGWFQDEEDNALRKTLSGDMIKVLLEQIRYANTKEKRRTDIVAFANSHGLGYEVQLGVYTFSYIAIEMENNIDPRKTQASLPISPLQKLKSNYKEQGIDEELLMYEFYPLNEKNDSFEPSAMMSGLTALKVYVKKDESLDFESYLYNITRPKPGDPLLDMSIVHNYSAPTSGGMFGCARVGTGCFTSNIPSLPQYGTNEKVHAGIDVYSVLNIDIFAMYSGTVEKVVKDIPAGTLGTQGELRCVNKSGHETLLILCTYENKKQQQKAAKLRC